MIRTPPPLTACRDADCPSKLSCERYQVKGDGPSLPKLREKDWVACDFFLSLLKLQPEAV